MAIVILRRHAPILSMRVTHIADKAIRNRGMWDGSVACADLGAKWPAGANINAFNDALAPYTPKKILKASGRI